MDGVWLQKLADWGWLLLLAVGGAVFRLFNRVTASESRLTAIEKNHGEIQDRIDVNNRAILESIEGLRKEMRDDYRMVVANLLERVPRA